MRDMDRWPNGRVSDLRSVVAGSISKIMVCTADETQ